jgi:hypothetical protein
VFWLMPIAARNCPGDISLRLHSARHHRLDRRPYRDFAQRHDRAERAAAYANNGERDCPISRLRKSFLDSKSYTKENCRRRSKVWYLKIAALMS